MNMPAAVIPAYLGSGVTLAATCRKKACRVDRSRCSQPISDSLRLPYFLVETTTLSARAPPPPLMDFMRIGSTTKPPITKTVSSASIAFMCLRK